MKRTWLIVLAALFVTACSQSGDPNEVGELQPYINTNLGFRVDYPSNWKAVEDPDFLVGDVPNKLHAVIFLRDESSGVLFTVLIQQLDGEKTLAEFGDEQLAGAQSNSGDAQYSELAQSWLGGVDALSAQTRVEQSGAARLQRVVLAVNNGRGYGVSLMAPENSPLIKTMDEMLATFKFLP